MDGAELSDLKAMFADAGIVGSIAALGTLAALYAKDPRLPTSSELYGAWIAFATAFFGTLAMMRRVVATVRAQAARRKIA